MSQVLFGGVVSAQGTSPGPASGITYTAIIDSQGGGTFTLAGIVPINRPFGSGLDIRAAAPGSLVEYIVRNQTVYVKVYGEEPDYGPCPNTPGVAIVSPEELRLLASGGSTIEGTNTGNEGVPGGGDQP